MKTWQFWVIILVIIFVIVPLIYFAVIAKSVTNIVDTPVVYKTPTKNDMIIGNY